MIKNNEFLKKVIGFSIPTWIGFAISFLSTPIITRIFLPSEIGKINMFSTFLNLLMLVTYFGLDQSFVRFYKELPGKYTKNELFTFSLACSFGIGVIISFVIIFFNKFLSTQITGSENFFISMCLAVSLLMNVVLKFLNVYSRMEQDLFMYTIQSISVVFVGKIFFIIVSFWNPSHVNAIVLMTVGYVITATLFFWIKKNSIVKVSYIDKKSITSLFQFGLPLVPITMLSWLNNSLPQFMLKSFVSFSAIGIYTNAVSIATTMNLIQTGFNVYWIPFVYSNYLDSQELLQKIHKYITFLMCLLGMFIILSQDLIYLLLGSEFRSSKIFFPFLLISPISFTIAETTGVGIGISKKSYLNIISFLCSTISNILLSFILIPRIGIGGAAISSAVAALVLLIVKTLLGERYYKNVTSYFQTASSILLVVIAAFVNYLFFDIIIGKYILLIMLLFTLMILNRKIISEVTARGITYFENKK